MSHEPECTVTYFPCDCCEKTPCACEQIRAAYQRGRNDAAEAVAIVSRGLMQSIGQGISWQHMAAIAVKAARGDLSPHE